MSALCPERPSLRRILREPELWFLVGLTLAFVGRPLASGDTYFFRDLHLWSIPQREHLREIVRGGHLPLWDALTHGGQPFAGDVNNLALYPTAVLCLVLSPITAVNLEIALHFALAAAAMYALARVVGMTPGIGLFASIAFALCGISLSLANLWNRLFAMPHMVLLLLFWHLYCLERRYRWFLLAAAAGSLQLFAGSLETLLLAFPFAVGWSLLFPYPEAQPRRRRLAAALVLAVVILGLAAAQVAPMIQILDRSARAHGLSGAQMQQWSISPRRLPEILVPGFFGAVHTLDESDYWGAAQEDSGLPYLLSLYLGLTACVLAVSAVVSRSSGGPLPRRLRLYLGAVCAGAILLSLGRFLWWVQAPMSVSGMFLRYPAKFLFLVPLCVALLAASRAQAALCPEGEGDGAPRRLAAVFGICLVGLLGALVLLARDRSAAKALETFFFGRGANPRILGGIGHAALFAGASAALFLWRGRHEGSGVPIARALAIAVAIDLVWAGVHVNATAPRSILETRPPLADALRKEIGDGRLFRTPRAPVFRLRAPSNDLFWLADASRKVLLHNSATAFSIPVIYDEDFDGLASLRLVDLSSVLAQLPWDRRLSILSAGSVRAVISSEPLAIEGLAPIADAPSGRSDLFVYRNERAARLVELATYWRFARSPAEARQLLVARGFDPRQHAVLEGEGPAPRPAPCSRPAVEIMNRSPVSMSVRTESECPGFLVFSEPYTPGWRAAVDGAPAAMRPANAAFGAVFVPAGLHAVTRAYRPTALLAGTLVSLATVLACLLGSRVLRRRPAQA